MTSEHIQNLFLIGPMGSGKTTIGQRLSKELKLPFFDSDEVIEKRNGVAISTIFDIEGEAGFRAREVDVIDELTGQSGIVLSTGGGSILDSRNREHLRNRGFVVYLKAGINQILMRTSRDRKRPLLQGGNARKKLIELQTEREPLYMEIADLTIETDHKNARQVVEQIYNYKVER